MTIKENCNDSCRKKNLSKAEKEKGEVYRVKNRREAIEEKRER